MKPQRAGAQQRRILQLRSAAQFVSHCIQVRGLGAIYIASRVVARLPSVISRHGRDLYFSQIIWVIRNESPSAMSFDLFMMLVVALGCASIGWAVIYFVSESPTAPNAGRRPFAASDAAAESEIFGGQSKRGRIPRRSSIANARSGLAAR